MTTTERRSWCGICEAGCGLIATVEDGRLAAVRPDPEHPASAGFMCSKGMALPAVLDDPDRVTRPMRRRPEGGFEPVGWDEAMDDIGRRLQAVIDRHGRESVGIVLGNPSVQNYASFLAGLLLGASLRTTHLYAAASVDINNYYVANELLYGHNLTTPFPDFRRTDLALVLGSNLVVSHGSMATLGRVQDHLVELVDRGGRLVVVDPRRTETAALGEHVGILPGGDPWFLAALLHVLFRDGLVDAAALGATVRGVDFLRDLVADVDLDHAAAESGVPVERLTELAHALGNARSAAVYGRCGASLGRFSTLTKYFLDALAVVTGNLDRPGGLLFGAPYLDAELLTKVLGLHGYDRWRTRVDDLPEVLGMSPLASLAREITTPGRGQLRALVGLASNFGWTSPNPAALQEALPQLDLFVSLDPYITDTNHAADYVLPPAMILEREGFPVFSQLHAITPNAQWSEAVVEPRGEARNDAWILSEIFRRVGVIPLPLPGVARLAPLLRRIPGHLPFALISDLAMRAGPHGDWFGLRRLLGKGGGLRRRDLAADGRARRYAEFPPSGVLRKRVHHRDGRVHLDHTVIADEMTRLLGTPSHGGAYPLRLFTVRELRSQNSWLHNVPKLMSGGRTMTVRVHPDDGGALGVAAGDTVRLESPWGEIEVAAQISDEVTPGCVGMPAHWGHRAGSWRRARRAGGAQYNDLTPDDPEHVDRASGNAWLNGIPVRLAPVVPVAASEALPAAEPSAETSSETSSETTSALEGAR